MTIYALQNVTRIYLIYLIIIYIIYVLETKHWKKKLVKALFYILCYTRRMWARKCHYERFCNSIINLMILLRIFNTKTSYRFDLLNYSKVIFVCISNKDYL